MNSSFCVTLVKLWLAEAFECIELVLCGPSVPSTLRMFVIYRPPSSGCKATTLHLYLDEFSHLLEHVSIKKNWTHHIDYGNVDDKNVSDLAAILNDTNLQQHVKSATHYRDNILDLVITPVTGSVSTDVSVESLLTEHHIIGCKLVSNKPRPIRKEILYRNISAIDKQAIQNSAERLVSGTHERYHITPVLLKLPLAASSLPNGIQTVCTCVSGCSPPRSSLLHFIYY